MTSALLLLRTILYRNLLAGEEVGNDESSDGENHDK